GTAPPALHTLSLHDALPIFGSLYGQSEASPPRELGGAESERGSHSYRMFYIGRGLFCRKMPLVRPPGGARSRQPGNEEGVDRLRSEEHTSELQSRGHLVCRL